MKRLILISTICVLGLFSKAQDIHFSEFFATPLFTSPALTGQFEGTYRFSGVIRRQWASVSAQPFQTFGGGAEINKPFNIKPIALGLRVYHDYTGLSALTTTSVAVPLALKLRFGSAKNFTVSVAGQAEFLQRTIDFSKLSFDDQYFSNRYNRNFASAENSPSGTSFVFNFSAGIYVEKRISERKRIGAGISSFNVAEPNLALYATSQEPLPIRNNIHFFSSVPLGSSNFDLMPAGQFQFQGIHDELLIGSAFRYHLSEASLDKRSVQIGFWGRTRDAAYLSAGFTKNNLFIGGSYDFNLSKLRTASEYLGGWEVSIIYTLSTVREKIKRVRQCPDFL